MKRKIAEFFQFHNALAASLPVLLVSMFQFLCSYGASRGEAETGELQMYSGLAFQAVVSTVAICFSVRLLGMNWREFFHGGKTPAGRAVLLGLKYGIAAVFAVLGFSAIQGTILVLLGVPDSEQPIFDLFSDPAIPVTMKAVLAFDGVLIAPVLEELMFRGVLLRCWSHRARRFAIPLLISAFYFALMHLYAPAILPLTFFAVLLGLAWRSTQSLIVPIVMHAVFNLSSLIVFLLQLRWEAA